MMKKKPSHLSASGKERDFPGERWVRTFLRTIHLTFGAMFFGGLFFCVSWEGLRTVLAWTILSGCLFTGLELYGTFQWLFQVRGLVTVFKILLLCLIPFFWPFRFYLALLIIVLASISSHMPSQWRYYNVARQCLGKVKKG